MLPLALNSSKVGTEGFQGVIVPVVGKVSKLDYYNLCRCTLDLTFLIFCILSYPSPAQVVHRLD